ncbi:MAG: JAB domain-containing protein [Deltaproteobacteria bacterium]|nr:JAB domain-containing protein [Deltaproteobacteria bacterium]
MNTPRVATKEGRAATGRPPRALYHRVTLVRDSGERYSEPLRTSSDVYRLFAEDAGTWDRERFLVLALDGKNRLLGAETLSVGTLTASLVHPREVMKSLILSNAAAFILLHNHPSGDPTPSAEDRAITQRLKEVGDVFGMRLLDHVIVGSARYCSMSDEAIL